MNNYPLKFYGISLIEIMITLLVIAILSSIGTYSYQEYKSKSLYTNSMIIMEQNKSIIYSYFSKFKECPTSRIITQNLNNSSKGSKIINNQCDLIICDGIEEILSFNATIYNDTNNDSALILGNEGIKYTCNLADTVENQKISKYLPQCTIKSNSSRCIN